MVREREGRENGVQRTSAKQMNTRNAMLPGHQDIIEHTPFSTATKRTVQESTTTLLSFFCWGGCVGLQLQLSFFVTRFAVMSPARSHAVGL
jgi:hypothetical protein